METPPTNDILINCVSEGVRISIEQHEKGGRGLTREEGIENIRRWLPGVEIEEVEIGRISPGAV